MGQKLHISAGGVVYTGMGKDLRIGLLYRTKTDTWHLPKGTQEVGEALEATARREIREETGLQVVLGTSLGSLDSRMEDGGPKQTHYFLARVTKEAGTGDGEHDQLRFFTPTETVRLLKHTPTLFEREHSIVARAIALLQ